MKLKRKPTLYFVLTMSSVALVWGVTQSMRATSNELQSVKFTYNQTANENNWFNQAPTLTIQLYNGVPSVSYAIVPEGTTPSNQDYISVDSQTLGYQSQYRYRYITRETVYSLSSPGNGWVKTGNQKEEDYWKAVRTETGITPGELALTVDRYFAIESNGTYTKLTNRIEDEVPTTVSYDTIYRYEADGFYHTAPAYYANGQAVPVVWQGKYTKTTGPSNLYKDNYLKVQWNTDPNRTLYKYDQIWAPMSTTDYLPLLLGVGQNAHVESSPYRDSEWWRSYDVLAAKNKNVTLVGVDFKKTAYQRAKRTTYEWGKDTDSGYLYTQNLSESQTKPSGTVQHEQTTVITSFQVKLPSNGKYQIYVKQNDGLGNTKTVSETVRIDTTSPTFTSSVSARGEVSYQASDSLSGIASVKLPNGQVLNPSSAGSSSLSGTVSLRSEGVYPFEVTDLAGNRQTFLVTYEKDLTPPTVTHTLNPTSWTNGSVTIRVQATDSSGVESILLPNNQVVYSDRVDYAVQVSGNYPFMITDRAGNVSNYSVSVTNIDQENPTVSLTSSTTDWTNQSVTLTVAAQDQPSGVKEVAYQVNGGSWTTLSNNGRITQSNEGTFRYRAKATDQAGNTKTTNEVTIQIDKTKPTGSTSLSTTAATSQPVTITVTGQDALSGVKEIQKPDGVKVSGNKATYKAQENGIFTFLIIDYAGNVLTHSVKITNIDNGAPTLTLTVPNADQWSQSKTIQAKAEDTQGIQWIKLPNGNLVYQSSASYTVTENDYYYFEAADTLGNVTRNYIYVGKIDREWPALDVENFYHNIWSNEDVGVTMHGYD